MTIRIHLARALKQPVVPRWYRLCNLQVEVDMALDPLVTFEADRPTESGSAPAVDRGLLRSGPAVGLDVAGDLAGRRRRIVLRPEPAGIRLEVQGVGRYRLDEDASEIELESAGEDVDVETLIQCTLGLPLVAALAVRGIWVLHAGAVVCGGVVVAIAGASGAGKSTLAARMGRLDDCARIADDLLAVRADDTGVRAMPAFPQLKLPSSEQPAGDGELPVARLAFLKRIETHAGPAVGMMKDSEGLLALAEHTVGALAFPPGLLSRHFEFCRRAAQQVPCIRIDYPHHERGLRETAASLVLR